MSSRLMPPTVGREHLAEPDHVVGIGGVDLQVEDIDVGEPLEQNRLSLHHRLPGKRPDVPQAENGSPVGDHGDQVPPVGEPECRLGIVGDDQARFGDTRGVGEAQIGLGGRRFGRT